MDEIDPNALRLVELTQGERLVDCWAASRQGYAQRHNYLVLTSNRLLYLHAAGFFSSTWKVVVNAPLASIDEPTTTLGRLNVAGRHFPLGLVRAGTARDAIHRTKEQVRPLARPSRAGPRPGI